MKQVFGLLILLSLLVACNDNTFKPTPVPFESHLSVIRGDWSGEIQDFPETGQTTSLQLTDSVASFCTEPNDAGQCLSYSFSGDLQVGDTPAQVVTGQGSSSRFIYTQTSPVPPFRIQFEFVFDGINYMANTDGDVGNDYRGLISHSEDFYSFNLTPFP